MGTSGACFIVKARERDNNGLAGRSWACIAFRRRRLSLFVSSILGRHTAFSRGGPGAKAAANLVLIREVFVLGVTLPIVDRLYRWP